MGKRLPRVALVGINGYGTFHLRDLAQRRDRVELIAVCDPASAELPGWADTVPHYRELSPLLAETAPDVVIIATPINTHLSLAELALRAGADVLLEKPPTATLAQYEQLLAAERETAGVVQIGFQALGSAAISALQTMIELGRLGTLTGISGVGAWARYDFYYRRSDWAGRRRLAGRPVMDGVVTNPLAHATSAALRLGRADTREQVAEVEVDLWHANPIEADDTAVVRVVTEAGLPITLGLTLCSQRSQQPAFLELIGTELTARLRYTEDVVELWPTDPDPVATFDAGRVTEPIERHHHERTHLLDNLLEHRAGGAELICPLSRTGGFMRVVDAVATHEPRTVAARQVRRIDDGTAPDGSPASRLAIEGIDHWIRRAAYEHRTFVELEAPFTR